MRRPHRLALTVVTAMLVAVPLCCLWPMWARLFTGGWLRLVDDGQLRAATPTDVLFRTVGFAVGTTVTALLFGFGTALTLRRLKAGWAVRMLSLCVLPSLVGGTVIGVAAKLWLRDVDFNGVDRLSWAWLIVAGLHVWQYSLLCCYLYWLDLGGVPGHLEQFARHAGLSFGERVRHIWWPQVRNLTAVLALFVLVQGLHEGPKSKILLGASEGSGTELFSHRLARYYQTAIPSSYRDANTDVLDVSTGLFVATLVLIFATTGAVLTAGDLGSAVWSRVRLWRSDGRLPGAGPSLTLFLVGLALLPFSKLLGWFHPVYLSRWCDLPAAVPFAAAAALAATAMAVTAAGAGRLRWPERLARFDRRSLPVFAALAVLHAVPTLAVYLCTRAWLPLFDLRMVAATDLLWLVGQVVLVFPVLAMFALNLNFAVSTREIRILAMYGLTAWEVAGVSFLRRLKTEYALLAVFAFTVVWFEDQFSPTISGRSFRLLADELRVAVERTGGDLQRAAGLIVGSLLPIMLLLSVWEGVVRQRLVRQEGS